MAKDYICDDNGTQKVKVAGAENRRIASVLQNEQFSWDCSMVWRNLNN